MTEVNLTIIAEFDNEGSAKDASSKLKASAKKNDHELNRTLNDLYAFDGFDIYLPLVDKFCQSPGERPYLFGFSAQEVIEMGKDTIPPGMAAMLLMEYAVPMSKIGPDWLQE